jgi:hypothetical protein
VPFSGYLCYYPWRRRETFCGVRHRVTMIEPTPLIRETEVV